MQLHHACHAHASLLVPPSTYTWGQHTAIIRHMPRSLPQPQRRQLQPVRAGADDDNEQSGGKGLFGFVTDNPSSRNAIQQEGIPSTESDIGRISARLRDKGRDYGDYWGARSTGSSSRLDELTWFIREIGDKSADSARPPTLFLHGVPSSSWSFMRVLTALDTAGWHAYAPDWIGFGYSEKPQSRYGFDYTEAEFHTALDHMLEDKNIALPLNLVAHGFITGQYAALWALAHPEAVAKLVIMDMPLTAEVKLPLGLVPLRFPLIGDFAAQNCLIAERTLEAGTPYVMDIDDAEIYRYPYLTTSSAGVALQETVKKADLVALGTRLAAGLAAGAWSVPTLILTGDADKYIKVEDSNSVAAANSSVITSVVIDAAGHQPQEDYPQLVVKALVRFLRP